MKAKKINCLNGWTYIVIGKNSVKAYSNEYAGIQYYATNANTVYYENEDGEIEYYPGLKAADVGITYWNQSNNNTTNGQSLQTDVEQEENKSAFDFGGLFSGIGDLFGGIANFSSSITGKGTPIYNYYGEARYGYNNQQTNTWLLYGGLLLFVVLILFLLLKK